MPATTGFDNERYLEQQSAAILERVNGADHKLYLEFGGKLLLDYHAARVLPGFQPDVKIRLLQKLRDQAERVVAKLTGTGDISSGFDDNNIQDMTGWITVYFLAPVPASIPDILK